MVEADALELDPEVADFLNLELDPEVADVLDLELDPEVADILDLKPDVEEADALDLDPEEAWRLATALATTVCAAPAAARGGRGGAMRLREGRSRAR